MLPATGPGVPGDYRYTRLDHGAGYALTAFGGDAQPVVTLRLRYAHLRNG